MGAPARRPGRQRRAANRLCRKWRAFCAAVAERYQGRVSAYQIWNEPNLSREWGDQIPDAARYVELLAVCSGAIRQRPTQTPPF